MTEIRLVSQKDLEALENRVKDLEAKVEALDVRIKIIESISH
ncbi:MAG: hypothetical protein ABIH76_07105 [Candidatus Bathyarchaeota archaeon]